MEFTHFNEYGKAKMVDVSEKNETKRVAIAKGSIKMNPKTIKMIKNNQMKKGDVLSVAQIGGITGAKKTWDIIPMCHNIFLTGSDIKFNILEDEIEVEATVSTVGKTGVEMEALTAASVAMLTIYDMCKVVDKEMVIGNVRVMKKIGGKSGEYIRNE
ncbi:cyclic pyranopterin monophosphate synthase MoaC [Paraclostridium sordellii]|uniref:Cyclic pyranopterin monophosphate synthase n=1 Tax=Paraclostridium sordellii TaxID=1505 RepID=A0A0C7G4Q4_PARSO|nr:cyclic pyranopterin monophosphate synthase MoaC [Paeniclostridium sordellii]CEN77644.1 molybdenum cofactor biosynthesis protein C [[Clostridium] sordellii] [Paeniclostridium sordellii]CEQ02731.1 molybdenum cofactor biosynthesis protein C [[Clostridium] sordellii] [Paeniclostridium sordellii]